ncbi:histidine phosphatase family protein [Halomonas sp. LR3S48]|uniref:histidine phosphatase family protein n=1 Tax=Halomonadaceae TaxID=28256 RepID=UPI0021E42825|nr:histidine phosphatase family protein [Halomonas sp. LR3S48]UYG02365.1 histidine phosphatase family protein [Halomonas sp. LR3S48]
MAAAGRLELVVVRHGLTQWNRERRYQGQRDIPLLLPDAVPGLDRLRVALEAHEFDTVHCSDLTRCRQTLAHVMEERAVLQSARFDARLRELHFGDYEGCTYDELESLPHYRAWIDSAGAQAPPGGESTAELRQRLEAWFADLLAGCMPQGQYRTLVVTHGGVIRELRRRFEGIGFWEGGVSQAEGRIFTFIHERECWQCSSSSAVPVPASVAS